MLVKTQTLSGKALDFATANLRGYTNFRRCEKFPNLFKMDDSDGSAEYLGNLGYHHDYGMAMSVIEERIGVLEDKGDYWYAWVAPKKCKTIKGHTGAWAYGNNLIEAALRAILVAEFGLEMEVPEELLK